MRKRKTEVRTLMTKSETVGTDFLHNLTFDIFSPSPNVHPEVRERGGLSGQRQRETRLASK